MTALRFQKGWRHQKSPAFLRAVGQKETLLFLSLLVLMTLTLMQGHSGLTEENILR